MKSRQFLSVVFSLIMFTGVTAGNAVFAESDDDDDVIEDFEDCVEANGVIGDNPDECTIDGTVFVNNDDDDDDDANKVLVCHKDKKTLSISEDALPAHLGHGDDEGPCDVDTRADYMHDEYSNKGSGNLRDHMAMFCDMTVEEREAKVDEKHPDLSDDLRDELLGYCEMSEEDQDDFRDSMMDRMDELHDSMKDKMMDKKSHMDYERLCTLDDSELEAEIDDSEKLDRISDWCEMTPEEREDYKKEHHYAKDDKKHDFDGMSDMVKDRMSDVAKDKLYENKMKMSDKSDRLKAMIMDKRDISDERYDEIRMKYEEKHGDLVEKKTELKMKFYNHMKTMKYNISDERKSDIHDRLAEMKAFKSELREKSSELTDEEKQQLREDFIEQAKDMQLAWISPRTQMTAGIDAAEVQCREGFNLVMKASNGVAMCLKADTALKMIDRGIVVPAI
ncbi:MAG: ABC transporter substrate-binding protein [Nitrosopumilus sp.]|nr:ABC transporter substrate-binding protein [Nitrosopumilus sp.]